VGGVEQMESDHLRSLGGWVEQIAFANFFKNTNIIITKELNKGMQTNTLSLA
jgi:hypothetical protein